MFHVLYFGLVFLIFYLLYSYIFGDMLKKEKYTKISELTFLVNKFNLDKKKMDYKECLRGVALMNGFIIGFTVMVIDWLPISVIFWLPIALVMLLTMIYTGYMLYGKYLNKKWGKDKDGN